MLCIDAVVGREGLSFNGWKLEIAQIVRFLPGVNFLIDLSVSQSN